MNSMKTFEHNESLSYFVTLWSIDAERHVKPVCKLNNLNVTTEASVIIIIIIYYYYYYMQHQNMTQTEPTEPPEVYLLLSWRSVYCLSEQYKTAVSINLSKA